MYLPLEMEQAVCHYCSPPVLKPCWPTLRCFEPFSSSMNQKSSRIKIQFNSVMTPIADSTSQSCRNIMKSSQAAILLSLESLQLRKLCFLFEFGPVASFFTRLSEQSRSLHCLSSLFLHLPSSINAC